MKAISAPKPAKIHIGQIGFSKLQLLEIGFRTIGSWNSDFVPNFFKRP
jgi:hypothetical protein